MTTSRKLVFLISAHNFWCSCRSYHGNRCMCVCFCVTIQLRLNRYRAALPVPVRPVCEERGSVRLKGVRCNCNCAVHLLNHLFVEQRSFRAMPAQTAVKMGIRCIIRTMYVWNKTHVFKNYSLFCSYILFFLFPVESTWHKISMTMAKMQ